MQSHAGVHARAGSIDFLHDRLEIRMIKLPREPHGSGKVIGADHDGVKAGMGQDGLEILHGTDVLDLGHKKHFPGHTGTVGIKILSEDIGAAVAHAAVLRGVLSFAGPVIKARIGGPADGPVKLLTALDHRENEALCACLQRKLDVLFRRFGKTGERRGSAALDPPEHIGQNAGAEGAVFHINGHPVIPGPGH